VLRAAALVAGARSAVTGPGLAGNGVGHWDFALGVNEFTG